MLAALIQSFDIFGAPLKLNYAGNTQYTSVPGGIVSLCVKLVIFVFVYFRLRVLMTRSMPMLSEVSTGFDLNKHDKYLFSEQGLTLGIDMFAPGGGEVIDILPLFNISLVWVDMTVPGGLPVPLEYELKNGTMKASPDSYPIFGSPTSRNGATIQFTILYSDCALESIELGRISESCNEQQAQAMAQIYEKIMHGLRIYAEEHYLDLNDFDEPFKTREVALSIITFPILQRHSEAQVI